jgi:TonB family protein
MSGTELAVHITPERRANPRIRLQRLAYIRVEPDNGAIVVDATSEGIRFYAAAPLHQNGNVQFSFSLSDNRRIEATARLVWADETKKSGGLAFSSVPAQVVEQILDCCSTPNDPPVPERLPVTSGTATILPEWPEWEEEEEGEEGEEGNSSLLVVRALAAAGKIPRAANQRPPHDPEALKQKLIPQRPVAARLPPLPERKSPRSVPVSRTTLVAFLMGVLFSIPILFLTKLVTEIIHRPLTIAAPQTQLQLPPAVTVEAQPIPRQDLFQNSEDTLQGNDAPPQQPIGGLVAPPQLVPRKAKSAKSNGPAVSETNDDPTKDRNALSDRSDPNMNASAEHLGSPPLPGARSDGNGAAGAFGNGAAVPLSGGSGNSREKLNTSVFASSATESGALKPRADDTRAVGAQPLVILDKPLPVYTEEARRLAIEGEVLIEVVFSTSGQVRVVRMVKGLGHGLDEAAVNAAQRIRFEPALQNGQPVDVPATVHIVFQLAF